MYCYFLILAFFASTLAEENFIIGGDDVTEEGKWPWQGSMKSPFGGHVCGVSLISKRWGVTAAHCVKGESAAEISVMFGSNDRTAPDVDIFPVKQIIMHEKYMEGEGNYPNDIAVLEFVYDVTGDHIAPVPLAPAGSDHAGNNDCWMTGWGITSIGGIPKIMQEAQVPVFSQPDCEAYWGEKINKGHVCTGDLLGGKTSCNGDSGGPLVCKVNGRYELVGATSWGVTKCYTFLPAVYSRVAYFREWIKEKTGV